jgi:hypothetical protein
MTELLPEEDEQISPVQREEFQRWAALQEKHKVRCDYIQMLGADLKIFFADMPFSEQIEDDAWYQIGGGKITKLIIERG